MKDSKEPVIIILVLFLIVGLAYSPLKKQAAERKANSTQTSSAVSETPSNASVSSNKPVAESIKDIESEIKSINTNVETTNRSPYYGKVRMSGIAYRNAEDPNQEYISLYTNLQTTETIKITGWYFKSELTGNFAYIPKASLLPFPFTKSETDVSLQQGDTVYITKGFSPIGISFRTNSCTGYFNENRTFYPQLSQQCPLVRDEKLPTFSSNIDKQEECENIINQIPRCTTRNGEYLYDLPDTVETSCKNYIQVKVGYNACVATHFGDTSFPGNEYRLFLNHFGPLWRTTHDKINLHDENGLVVDTTTY